MLLLFSEKAYFAFVNFCRRPHPQVILENVNEIVFYLFLIQMNINHKEILQELNNWPNWPQNLWLAGENEHLQTQIESLKRLCMVGVDQDSG